jgi:hypothetical protein
MDDDDLKPVADDDMDDNDLKPAALTMEDVFDND